ncbi:MAG: apolipoprotein N-acyltransferase, partial [Abditibacteriota bacterium]|nr:apolipoprotein N-acyltransferase [Abditibacteriota bacterium]
MTAKHGRLAGPGTLFLLTLLSAGLTFAAAQFPWLWFLSFGSLYPLVYALLLNGLSDIPLRKRLAAGAGLGLIFGFAYFSACLYWMWRFMPGLNFVTGLFQGSFFCLFGLLSPFFTRRFSFCLAGLPCLWVACELLRSAGPFGFCWYSIANIQASNLPLLQYTSLLGYRVLDFLVVFLVCAFVLFFTDKSKPHRLFALGAVVLFAALQIGGELLILPLEGADKTVKLIQANMDPVNKTDPEAIGLHTVLTRKTPKADLVIWPETTVSMLSLIDRVSIGMTAAQVSAPIIVGANVPREDNYTNSAVMFSAKGKRTGQYDKCRLVPFGEYTPFRRLFKK